MGYNTDFDGEFTITPTLNVVDKKFLLDLSNTRRMKRNVGPEYGIEGAFYTSNDEEGIIDYNETPGPQPSLWNHWIPNNEGDRIIYDGGEKFYCWTEWIVYLIEKVFRPRGYVISGDIKFTSENYTEGVISVKDNIVIETIKDIDEDYNVVIGNNLVRIVEMEGFMYTRYSF